MGKHKRTLGFGHYARIAAFVREHGPVSVREIVEGVGGSQSSVGRIVAAMCSGVIYVSEWRASIHRARHVPLLSYGKSESVPCRTGVKFRRAPTFTAPMMAFLATLEALESPQSLRQLCASMHKEHSVMTVRLQALRRLKLARIAAWGRCPKSGAALPLYQLGSGPNHPKPKPASKQTLSRRAEERRAMRKLETGIKRLKAASGAPPPRVSRLAANSVFAWRGAA